jgi:hypothetical protein
MWNVTQVKMKMADAYQIPARRLSLSQLSIQQWENDYDRIQSQSASGSGEARREGVGNEKQIGGF